MCFRRLCLVFACTALIQTGCCCWHPHGCHWHHCGNDRDAVPQNAAAQVCAEDGWPGEASDPRAVFLAQCERGG
jgi:hypothetical protein